MYAFNAIVVLFSLNSYSQMVFVRLTNTKPAPPYNFFARIQSGNI